MRTNKLLISMLGAGLLTGVLLAPTTVFARGDRDGGRDRQEQVEHRYDKGHHQDHHKHHHSHFRARERYYDKHHRYHRYHYKPHKGHHKPVVVYREAPVRPPVVSGNSIGIILRGVWD